jgi:hypothetical protein
MNRSSTPTPYQVPAGATLSEPFAEDSGLRELRELRGFSPHSREAETEPPPPPSSAQQRPRVPADAGERPTLVKDLPPPRREALTEPAPSSNAAEHAGARPAARIGSGAPPYFGDRPLPVPSSERGIDAALSRMRDAFAEGDYELSLQAAQQVLAALPSNPDALSYARTCERLLEKRHVDRIGHLDAVPVLAVDAEQVRWLALDHREGFVLSLVDGVTTVEELIDISGLGRVDLLKTVGGLLEAEVIRLR